MFSGLAEVSSVCRRIHTLNRDKSGPNLYRPAPVLALLGIKSVSGPYNDNRILAVKPAKTTLVTHPFSSRHYNTLGT
jgi:hypothetical protein